MGHVASGICEARGKGREMRAEGRWAKVFMLLKGKVRRVQRDLWN
jgi:hypothetical protein